MERKENNVNRIVLLVNKLGKRGYSSKQRLLVVTENEIAYFAIPSRKDATTLEFVKNLENFVKNPKILNSSTNHSVASSKEYSDILMKYLMISHNFSLKASMPLNSSIISLIDPSSSENLKSFQCPVKISEGSSEKKSHVMELVKEIDGSSKKKDKNKANMVWIMDFHFVKLFEEVSNLKNIFASERHHKAYIRQVEVSKFNENHVKQLTELKSVEKKTENHQNKRLPDFFNSIVLQETFYQKALTDYNFAVDPEEKLNAELFVQSIYKKFTKVCEILVKQIVLDLSSKPFSDGTNQGTNIFPIVFPDPSILKKDNNGLFLYSMLGINIELTWVTF